MGNGNGGLTFEETLSFFQNTMGMTAEGARVAAIGRNRNEAEARAWFRESAGPVAAVATTGVNPDVAERARTEAWQEIDNARRRPRTPTAVGRAMALAESAVRLSLNMSAADATSLVERIRTREASAGRSSIEFLECFARELAEATRSGGR